MRKESKKGAKACPFKFSNEKNQECIEGRCALWTKSHRLGGTFEWCAIYGIAKELADGIEVQ